MILKNILKEKKMSIYQLSKKSNLPYSTCNDIVNEKVNITKCSVETIYKIANVLNISIEDLISLYLKPRCSFENFKSTICHRLKELGDINFLITLLESNDIRSFFEQKWYPESLYLLAMLDYVSKENNIPICNEYDDIRHCKLKKTIYPSSIIAISIATKSKEPLNKAFQNAIPEFKRFNIIEKEVRNVI